MSRRPELSLTISGSKKPSRSEVRVSALVTGSNSRLTQDWVIFRFSSNYMMHSASALVPDKHYKDPQDVPGTSASVPRKRKDKSKYISSISSDHSQLSDLKLKDLRLQDNSRSMDLKLRHSDSFGVSQ